MLNTWVTLGYLDPLAHGMLRRCDGLCMWGNWPGFINNLAPCLQKEPRVEGGGSISVFRAVRSEDVFLELATRRQFKVLLWQVILIQTLVWLID